MAKVSIEGVLSFLNASGGKSSRELCARFSVSQPTMSRLLSSLSRNVVCVGRGPRSRYFSLREQAAIPIFRVNEQGFVVELGELSVLHGGFLFNPATEIPSLSEGDFRDGIFESLPWFLHEMRPQGYLGRAITRALGSEGGFPQSPQDWDDDAILRYLLRYGGDEPGALIVGEYSRERFLSGSTNAVSESDRERAYATLAENALAGRMPGSSAAGEQPKFVTAVSDGNGRARQVIVKFSGNLDLPAEERRADLLIAEYWAGEVLRDAGIPVPAAELVFADGRCFLESERIDRVGARGRRWTCSLASIEPALIGSGCTSWRGMVSAGVSMGIFSRKTLEQVIAVENFGRAIGNDDMHWGNLSFMVADRFPFVMAPIYDMLPMAYRVRADSSFPQRALRLFAPDELSARMAKQFWERVSDDTRISRGFRSIAKEHASAIDA